jgi:hypothetical protein
MFPCDFVCLRLGRRSPSGALISTDSYMRIPSAPLSGSYVSTHTLANSETNPGLQVQLLGANISSRPSVYEQLLSLAWKMVDQHPSGEICALSDNQVNLPSWLFLGLLTIARTSHSGMNDAVSRQHSRRREFRPPSEQTQTSTSLTNSRPQESCVYEPAVQTASSYNDFPTPLVLSDHPLSLPQSSGEVQQVRTYHAFCTQVLNIIENSISPPHHIIRITMRSSALRGTKTCPQLHVIR